jgi:hypothetical protein
MGGLSRATVSTAMRRSLYPMFLTTSLTGTFAAAISFNLVGTPRVTDTVVFALVATAVGGLLVFRPRPVPFLAGLLLLVVAFVGFWLASPPVRASIRIGAFDGLVFAYLTLLFPAARVLLAASVSDWLVGLGSYLTFGVTAALMVRAASYSVLEAWLLTLYVLLWPPLTLLLLGIFGWRLGAW